MSERQSKAAQDRNERILNDLVKQNGNDRCADCNAKNPRWASYSLGVFLCIRCAGIHRKMGTHISKVKSITMDQWSSEQIEMMRKSGGNIAVNSRINPHPDRHPLPLASDDEHAMEKYIRAKWEKRAFSEDNKVMAAPKTSTINPINRLQTLPKRSSSVPIINSSSSSNNNLSTNLNQLRQMGFIDEMKNRQVLVQTQGNVEAAVDILSRSIPQHFTSSLQQPSMSDEQKLSKLCGLGFTNINLNMDALRRAGGNIDIAITILKENRSTTTSQQSANSLFSPIQLQKSASVNTSMNSNNNSTGGFLVDVDPFSTVTASHNMMPSNPFATVQQPLPLQYQSMQQQQQPTASVSENPFSMNNTFINGNPQANLHNMLQQQPLITPQTVAQQQQQQPTINSSNPFSQMANPPFAATASTNMNAIFQYPAVTTGGYNPMGQVYSTQHQPQQQQQQQQQQQTYSIMNTWPANHPC